MFPFLFARSCVCVSFFLRSVVISRKKKSFPCFVLWLSGSSSSFLNEMKCVLLLCVCVKRLCGCVFKIIRVLVLCHKSIVFIIIIIIIIIIILIIILMIIIT